MIYPLSGVVRVDALRPGELVTIPDVTPVNEPRRVEAIEDAGRGRYAVMIDGETHSVRLQFVGRWLDSSEFPVLYSLPADRTADAWAYGQTTHSGVSTDTHCVIRPARDEAHARASTKGSPTRERPTFGLFAGEDVRVTYGPVFRFDAGGDRWHEVS